MAIRVGDTTRGARRTYRVEHRAEGAVRVLARGVDVAPHYTALVPWASRLLLDGAAGVLTLIDEATGAVVARRDLARAAGTGQRRERSAERAAASAQALKRAEWALRRAQASRAPRRPSPAPVPSPTTRAR